MLKKAKLKEENNLISERKNFKNKSNKTIEKIKQKIKQLLLVSTSHGLPHAFKSNRIFFKIMWLSLFITSSLLGINTVIGTINAYINYEIVTKIDVITEMPTHFPAITIINLRNRKSNMSLNELMILCKFNLKECKEDDFEMIIDKLGFVSYRFKEKKSYTPGMQRF